MTTPKAFRDAFVERVRIARVAANFTVDAIAMILRVRPNTYRRYEGARGENPPTIMPPHLVPLFCAACHVSETWLFSGEGKGPAVARPIVGPREASSKSFPAHITSTREMSQKKKKA
jgi:transcriptional regulator with XRE-family HTH domain